MLEGSCSRVCQSGENVAGTRYGFQQIPDPAVVRVELEQKALFAFLAMMGGSGVKESKVRGRIDGLHNIAAMERPQTERMHLHSHDLLYGDGDFRVRDPHPAKIEFSPAGEGLPRSGKHGLSFSKPRPKTVMCKCEG